MSRRSVAQARNAAPPVSAPVGGNLLLRQPAPADDDALVIDRSVAIAPRPPLEASGHEFGPGPSHSIPTSPAALGRSRDFTRIAATHAAPTVADCDAVRAQITADLLRTLAAGLGLDPRSIDVRVDAGAEARVNASGASGVQEGATIYLHPGRYRPQTQRGRYLLAHEAVHLAQRRLMGLGDLRSAEREAAELGWAFADGGALRAPRCPLTVTAAADAGAEPSPPSLEASTQLIDQAVATSRSREIHEIKSLLSGLWVSDGDVFGVMRILDSVSFTVANAIVRSLAEQERYWLADNINPPHVYRHRRSVLLCYYHTLSDRRLQDAVDLKVFRALPATGLTTEEIEAANYTLRHLRDGQRQDLLRSGNAPAIKRIISAPRPSAQELERIRKEAQEAAADEAKLAEERKAILAHKDDPGAADLIEKVAHWLSPGRVDDQTRPPPGYAALQALNLLQSARAGDHDPRFRYVAEQLEQRGLIDQLLQALPADRYFDTPAHAATLIALVRARLPYKNERLIEDLLSYGLLDWAIRDYEAVFAYRLIKLMPLSDQYRFRLRDGGKWYLRLLENLPDDQKYPGLEIRKAESREELEQLQGRYKALVPDDPTGLATQVIKENGEEKLFYNASQLYEAKLERDRDARTDLNRLRADFKEGRKDSLTLYQDLVRLGGVSFEPGKEHPGDQVLREAVIRELDRLGYIEKLFGDLPEAVLFAEANRISTVKIMLARDPTRAQAHARALVSRGFTDWMVTDEEAYLAYLCIKALPQDERDAFIEQNAEAWGRIQGEMSASMRQSRDLNLYIGDAAGTDRASVLGQLADGATWSDDNAALLGDLVRMAIAMTEHRFAFERSKEFAAIQRPKLAPLVEKFRLWDPVSRPAYTPDILKGTRWYEEGVFASLKTLWSGLVTLWNADFLYVSGKAGAKVDLGDVQGVLGGDLLGARLGSPKQRGAKEPVAHPDANKLTLLIGTDGRSAELALPELLIDSANIQLAGSTLQSGQVALKGLHIHAAYDHDGLGQPTKAEAKFASLEANDLLLAKSRSMITVTRLIVTALRLAAGTIDTVSPGVGRERGGLSIPFPLLIVPLLALFVLLALPVYLYRKIAALFSQGLESDTTGQFAADVAERTKAISFTLGSLDVDSLTTSGGQHVDQARVRDFSLRVGLNKATRLRAEASSIGQRLKALQGKTEAAAAVAQLTERKAKIDRDLVDIERQELEYVAIQKELYQGKVTPERQQALQQRLDTLKFEDQGGAFIDVGDIEVSGIQGTVTSKEPIRLANIHGEGGSSALTQFVALPTATPAELSRRSQAGERPSPVLAPGQDGRFVLDLGDIHTGEITIGGGLRTVADIDRQLAELEPNKAAPHIQPLYESLETLRVKARRFELLVQHGVSQLTAPQLDEFRRLRQDLAAQADLIVQSIAIVHARLDADLGTGRVGFAADAVHVAGIDMPAKGIQVDEIIARGLGFQTLPRGGLLGWADWKQNLKDAEGQLDSLEISGARSKYHGLLFEKATLTGAYAALKDRGNALEVGLRKLGVQGVGIVPRIGLLNQRLQGLQQKARLAEAADKPRFDAEIAALVAKIAELQTLADARLAAYLRLDAARTPQEIAAAKDAVAEVDATIILGLAQYGASRVELDEFGVRATGAGDVLSDVLTGGADPLAVLERGGVRVQGTGEGQRVFKRFAVSGAQTAADEYGKKGLTGEAQAFELGETKLDAAAKKVGDSLIVDVPRFELAALSINQFLLTSSQGDRGYQLWSSGASGLEGIVFQGQVRLDSRKPGSRDLADYRLAHISVGMFRIGRIFGSGLGFVSLGDKLEVEIKSGAIRGVHADAMEIDLPMAPDSAPVLKGKAGIDAIDDLVIGKAVAGAWAVDRGNINARALDVELLEEGAVKASIGDLSLSSFAVRGPDGWARFSLAHLSGKLAYANGALDVEDFHLGTLAVSAIHWKVGAKGFVEANQPASLHDVRTRGRIETRLVPAEAEATRAPGEGKQQRKLSRFKIKELHVGTVEARHLIYQDEANRIELGPPEAALPKHMKGFKPLYLKNLDVWNLDWAEKQGFSEGHARLEKYEASAAYEGLKSGLKAGIVLTGGGMKAEVSGPGLFDVDIGKIEKIRGTYHDDKIDTKFATGQVVGSIALGPDFVEARDVEVTRIDIGLTTYTDTGRSLKLGGATIDKVKLGKVRQNYAKASDPGKHDDKVPTTLKVEGLDFYDITAGTFIYDGTSTGTTPDGKEAVSTQHIKGRHAYIEHLGIGSFTHDAARAESVLSNLKVDRGDKSAVWQPFGIRGLTANLVSQIGEKTTTTRLVTDIEGGPLTAEKITFTTVKLGTAPGKDGQPEDVTRTKIDGSFNLTRLGFINPDLTLTDEKGKTTRISAYEYGSLELKGVKPQFLPNGTVRLPIDAVVARKLQLQRGQGGTLKPGDPTLKIPLAEIRDIALSLKGMGTHEGLKLLAAKAGSLSASKITFDMDVDRSIDSSDEGFRRRMEAYREALANPGHALIAEPLGGLRGDAEVEPEHINLFWKANLPWDPNVTFPIRSGRINFEHVHPYAVNIRKGKLTIGNFWPEEHLEALALPADLPGVHPELGKYGTLDLRELVEGLYAAPPGEAPKQDDKAKDLSALKNVNLGVPSLSLGSGKMGIDLTDDKSLGPGDVYLDVQREQPGQNVLSIPWQHIGDRVELRMPHFHARGAAFPGGKTGAIDVLGIYVRIGNLAEMTFNVHVWVEEAKIKDIEFGDLTLLNAAELGKLEAPGARDVNPKAVP